MSNHAYSAYTFRRFNGRFDQVVEEGGADTLDAALALAHRHGYASPGERIEVRGPTNALVVSELATPHPTRDDEIVWKRTT